MSKALITESILTDIADAIRDKTSETATMKPTDMAAKIEGISGGETKDTTITSYTDDTIEVIGDKSFQAYPNLRNVTLGKCTGIGAYAFENCPELNSVSNNGTIQMTGSYAFANCPKLYTVTSLKITNPGVGIFMNCKTLQNAATVYWTTIPAYAFSGCVSLSSFGGIIATSIGSYAYSGCIKPTSIAETQFPKCTSIGSYAFENCTGLTSAIFRNVSSIADYAFSWCTALSTIELDEAHILSDNAFAGLSDCTVHFGLGWETQVKALTGYSTNFGGTNLTFVFDLGDSYDIDDDLKKS